MLKTEYLALKIDDKVITNHLKKNLPMTFKGRSDIMDIYARLENSEGSSEEYMYIFLEKTK